MADLLAVSDAARLDVSPETVRCRIRASRVPVVRSPLPRGRYRLAASQVERPAAPRPLPPADPPGSA